MSNRKNFLIILDIDNTLIDTTFFPVSYKTPSDPLTHSYPRPYLDCFMNYLLSNYYVGIWTAALPMWKQRVLNTTLKPYSKYFLFAWSGDQVCFDQSDNIIKPLKLVWSAFPNFGPHNTLFIDDTLNTGCLNPDNHLHIKPFIVTNSKKDNELFKIFSVLESTKPIPSLIKEKYNKLK